jgi:UDP-N-acetylmuramoyl-tripeptide--D-alanyl-D-alanine ligase
VHPTVVAITGSYGKTSTKGYVAHVLSGSYSVVASPASFNNLLGLSKAVNDRVVPGTEVFIAEMGVYGTGEIRELSESFPPDIAAITTIGEAHLARMGSREVIFQAKSEITEKARIVVLPIDDPWLAGLADKCEAEGKKVVRVSTVAGRAADVVVADGIVTVSENGVETSAPVSISNVGHAVNLAVTVGIAVALEVPLAAIASRLEALPESPHRAEISQAASGVLVIDDTYNANPVGAQRALEGAADLAAERRGPLVVVTPGMVELGSVQAVRNEAFGRSIAEHGGHLFAVARTNRRALTAGASTGSQPVRTFDRREQAVAAALDQAGDRGVILYENDLPDHYP